MGRKIGEQSGDILDEGCLRAELRVGSASMSCVDRPRVRRRLVLMAELEGCPMTSLLDQGRWWCIVGEGWLVIRSKFDGRTTFAEEGGRGAGEVDIIGCDEVWERWKATRKM